MAAVVIAEPNLTDHSRKHVEDVFNRAFELIGPSEADFGAANLMALLCVILYHDVGNASGRANHQAKIAEGFNRTWPNSDDWKRLRHIVMSAGGAHGGKTDEGSLDTLAKVDESMPGQFGEAIRLRDIAAITRFADELAEGPQRTNRYLLENGLIKQESTEFHDYASITTICIERNDGRIILMYDIDLKSNMDQKQKDWLTQLLERIYCRLWKLNSERQYARHYCDILSGFKETQATLRFFIGKASDVVTYGPIVLTDFDLTQQLTEVDLYKFYPDCKISKVLGDLESRMREKNAEEREEEEE